MGFFFAMMNSRDSSAVFIYKLLYSIFMVMTSTFMEDVALTSGSFPRRIVNKLRHFHRLLKMNNQ